VERARAQKPNIHEKEFGHYTVLSSDGQARYDVEYKKLDGQIYASCTCQGKKGVCLHCASCLGHFSMRVKERAAARFNASLCPVCHNIPSDGQICEDCQPGAKSDLILFGGE